MERQRHAQTTIGALTTALKNVVKFKPKTPHPEKGKTPHPHSGTQKPKEKEKYDTGKGGYTKWKTTSPKGGHKKLSSGQTYYWCLNHTKYVL